MRVAIHALGTRGDIQPSLALAVALRAAGDEVVLVAPTQFSAFITSHDIAFAPLPAELLQLMDTPAGKAAMGGRERFASGLRLVRQVRPIIRRQLTAEWEAARAFAPDVIVYHPKAIGAPHIAERLSCPAILASPLPGFTPTREFASPLLPWRSLGPLNRLTHRLVAGSADSLFRGMIADWRESELGLDRHRTGTRGPAATLYAYSRHVLPAPVDWPANAVVTGYWFLEGETEWAPDADLQAFLDAGEPPVYVGFGSMPNVDAATTTRLVVEALSQAGRRGILATGGGALRSESHPDHVRFIAAAPHAALFPRMAACVHHGGAGTTGAALRAGKPAVICPFFGDQPFWGRRIRELDAGPPPIAFRHLSVDRLAAAIEAATTAPSIRTQADLLGSRIRDESGIVAAIAAIKLVLQESPT